jgi:dihydrolipoamide dehydrogenase
MRKPQAARSPSSASSIGKVSLDLATMQASGRAVKGLTGGIEFLFKKNKVDVDQGPCRLHLGHRSRSRARLTAHNFIIATGSSVTPLPGVEIDNAKGVVVDSTGALELDKVPEPSGRHRRRRDRARAGQVWRRLGAKVTVVEYLDQILPGMDGDVRKEAAKIFKKQGFEIKLSAPRSRALLVKGKKATLSVEPAAGGARNDRSRCVLVSIGRKPNTSGLALDKAGLETLNARGQIEPTMISAPPSTASGPSAT